MPVKFVDTSPDTEEILKRYIERNEHLIDKKPCPACRDRTVNPPVRSPGGIMNMTTWSSSRLKCYIKQTPCPALFSTRAHFWGASLNNDKETRNEQERLIAEARRSRELREKEYREQALKLYPHICARCGREFEGRKLKELTVHHRNHNHDDNPPDGSNWELLCLYCHDNEHQKYLDEESFGKTSGSEEKPSTYRPFAGLDDLLKNKKP
jgi:5-methylcytosine-specific restriction endonuclease McrA